MENIDEDFSELVVLPAIDDDVHTGVQDKEEMGKVGENSAPEEKNIKGNFTLNVSQCTVLFGLKLI